jgi:acyl-ACP thioesterase
VPQEALSELVSPPEAGRVFEQSARAGFADCAPSGRIRLDGLARWLQDVAYADVDDVGLAEVAVWVVRRTRILVSRFPRFGERCSVSTFCSGLGRMWAERRTTIRAEGQAEADVEAVALWVHLDPDTWRPLPFHEFELERYGAHAAGRRVTARLRHPAPPTDGPRRGWSFRATELDIAQHINNAAYWQPLEDELLPGPDPTTLDVEIEFRTPCQPGEKLVVADGSPVGAGTRRWIVEGGGEGIASILVNAIQHA